MPYLSANGFSSSMQPASISFQKSIANHLNDIKCHTSAMIQGKIDINSHDD